MAKCFPIPLSGSTGEEDDLRDERNEIGVRSRGRRIEAKWCGGYYKNDFSSIMHGMLLTPFVFKLRRLRQKWRWQNLESDHEAHELDLHVDAIRLQCSEEVSKVKNLDELSSQEYSVKTCVPLCERLQKGIEGIRRDDAGAGKSVFVNAVVPGGTSQVDFGDVNRNNEGVLLTLSSSKVARFSKVAQGLDSQELLDGVHLAASQQGERCHQQLEKNLMPCGCFNNRKMEKLRQYGSRKVEKDKTVLQVKSNIEVLARVEQHIIPDDIIEMCLARVPFSTLVKARLVCKKWQALTMSCRFFEMREAFSSERPWLFVFGLSKDGVCMGQIQALDPTFHKWHTIQADLLSGRSLYSVAAIASTIYIIGGCSSLCNDSGRRIDKASVKIQKSVLAYNPLTSSWEKLSSMRTARAMPVVGVFEVNISHSSKGTSKQFYGTCQDGGKGFHSYLYIESERSTCRRLGPHNRDKRVSPNGGARCSLYRMEELTMCEAPRRHEACKPLVKPARYALVSSPNPSGLIKSQGPGCERPVKELGYGLIVVGGQGVCSEPLASAEIYDPTSNKWREIASLPVDHGVACAGAVCNGMFYVYSETDKLAAYDFQQNVWTRIQIPNPPGRLHEYMPKLLACRDRLLLLAVAWEDRAIDGVAREKATRIIWELNHILQTWSEVSKHPDAPLDWNALFVSEGDQIFGLEMFKIFGQVLDFITVCDTSGCAMKWSRVSRMHMRNDIDVSSCITKTAVIAQL